MKQWTAMVGVAALVAAPLANAQVSDADGNTDIGTVTVEIAGVNDAVVGMAVGEKKTVEIAPENGYGPRNDEMVVRVQTSQLPEGATIGTMLQIETPEGAVQVVLSAIDGDEAELDGNHPLAGKTMVFDLEIVEIVQPE